MSSTSHNQYEPDYAVPAGEILAEAIQERGWTQADLAARTGRPAKTINEIIQGKTSITPETALQFEHVLGIPARFWLNLDANCQVFMARARERDRMLARANWLETIPVNAMIRQGWLKEHPDAVSQLQEVLNFYAVASPDIWEQQWSKTIVAHHGSPVLVKEPGAVSAWLQRGELLARHITCAPYNGKLFRETLQQIRKLTTKSWREREAEIIALCAPCGVALVSVAAISKTRIGSATRWITPTKALIQLGRRYQDDYQYWSAFFHAAGHILLHGKREAFIDVDDEAINLKEAEANQFAADILLPPKYFAGFVAEGHFDNTSVIAFARELAIEPAIVVRTLQDQKLVPRERAHKSRLTNMKSEGNR